MPTKTEAEEIIAALKAACVLIHTLRNSSRVEFREGSTVDDMAIRIDERVVMKTHDLVSHVVKDETGDEKVTDLKGYLVLLTDETAIKLRRTDVVGFTTSLPSAIALALATAEELLVGSEYPTVLCEAIAKYETPSNDMQVN